MQTFDAEKYAKWFNTHYETSPFKSLRKVAEELSKTYDVSADTISRLANPRKQGLTDGYSRPKLGLVDTISDFFKRPRGEGRLAAGYAPETEEFAAPVKKPESIEELVNSLSDLGFDIQFDGDFNNFTAEDLQDLLDDIKAKLIVKSQRRSKESHD